MRRTTIPRLDKSWQCTKACRTIRCCLECGSKHKMRRDIWSSVLSLTSTLLSTTLVLRLNIGTTPSFPTFLFTSNDERQALSLLFYLIVAETMPLLPFHPLLSCSGNSLVRNQTLSTPVSCLSFYGLCLGFHFDRSCLSEMQEVYAAKRCSLAREWSFQTQCTIFSSQNHVPRHFGSVFLTQRSRCGRTPCLSTLLARWAMSWRDMLMARCYITAMIGSASYTAPMNIETLLSHNLTAFASASSISVGGNILIWQSSVNGNAYAVGNYSWVYAGTCLLISPRASFWRITPFFPSFRILLPPLLPASASLQSQRQMELGLHNKRLGFVVGVAPTRFFPFRLPSTPTPVLRQTRLPRFGGLSLLQCSLAQLSLSS